MFTVREAIRAGKPVAPRSPRVSGDAAEAADRVSPSWRRREVRIPQSETRQIAQDDIVIVIGFIRRPGHKVIATSGQPVSRWFPTTPRWAPEVP